MSHYDLYSALGLDRTADCRTLAHDIDRRLEALDNVGAQSGELRAARSVLGDPDRRSLYDAKLADPNAEDITIQAIAELAASRPDAPGETREMPATFPGHSGPPAPAYSSTVEPQAESETKKRNSLLMVAGAIIVAVALIAGITALLTSGNDGDNVADAGSANFTQSVTTSETPVTSTEESPSPSPTPGSYTPDPDPASASSSGSGSSSGSASGSSHRATRTPDEAGLSVRGWEGRGSKFAFCNVEEDRWVYAAYNSNGTALICQSAATGRYYYHGLFNSSGLEMDVDMGSADTGDAYYVIPAKPATIVIDGDRLTVQDGSGSTTKTENFTDYWTAKPQY